MIVDFGTIPVDSQSVHAVLDSSSLDIPPYVVLSFPGSSEPTALFAELEALGWVIPTRPAPPKAVGEASAYRVDDFVLREGRWSKSEKMRIGLATFLLLQRFDVRVHAPESYERLLFPGQFGDVEMIDLRSPADPPPHTLIIETAQASMAGSASYRTFRAMGGSTSAPLVWAERSRPVASIEVDAQRRTAKAALFAWNVEPGDVPVRSAPEMTALRLAIEDARRGVQLVQRLREAMSDRVAFRTLRPMAHSSATTHDGVLVLGLVPQGRVNRIRQLILERDAFVIARFEHLR